MDKVVPCIHMNKCASATLPIYKGKCYLTCPIYERRSGKERRRDVSKPNKEIGLPRWSS
jgi:hypothetical protein